MNSRFMFYISVLLLIFVYFYKKNNVVRYYTKFILFYTTLMTACIISTPLALLTPRNPKNLFYISEIVPIISPFLGLKWEIRGVENAEKLDSCVLMFNHQSSLDMMGLFYLWGVLHETVGIAKKEILYSGPIGLFLWLSGLIFIPRSHPDECKRILNEAIEVVKKDHGKLIIFPEGTRRCDGIIHEFKKGGFHMAVQAQLPIVPIVLSHYYFLDGKKKRFDRGKIVVELLPPIPTKGKTFDDMDALLNETREKMIAKFDSLKDELEK